MHVMVLGGGVIGVEFASVWRSFGSEVTIVEAATSFLAREDAEIVALRMDEEGLDPDALEAELPPADLYRITDGAARWQFDAGDPRDDSADQGGLRGSPGDGGGERSGAERSGIRTGDRRAG